MKILNRKMIVAGLGLALLHLNASAIDSVSGEFASGNRSQFVRAGGQWNWDNQWYKSNGNFIGGYWDVTLTQWRNNAYKGVEGSTQILPISVSPQFSAGKTTTAKVCMEKRRLVSTCFHIFIAIIIVSFRLHFSSVIIWA